MAQQQQQQVLGIQATARKQKQATKATAQALGHLHSNLLQTLATSRLAQREHLRGSPLTTVVPVSSYASTRTLTHHPLTNPQTLTAALQVTSLTTSPQPAAANTNHHHPLTRISARHHRRISPRALTAAEHQQATPVEQLQGIRVTPTNPQPQPQPGARSPQTAQSTGSGILPGILGIAAS